MGDEQVFILLSKAASQLLFYVLAKLSTQVKVYGWDQQLNQSNDSIGQDMVK